jgi:CubicO group peptidase (beta-lactamase class C family)
VSDRSPADDVATRLDEHLAPFVQSRDFSGYVLLARGGEIVVSRGYGWAQWEFEVPHTADTRYWAGSVSKLMTSVAFDGLAAAGTISRSDSLATYLPDFPEAEGITLAHLLDHTSGLARDLVLGSDRTEPHPTRELVDRVAALPRLGRPGEAEAYSNNGYVVLARVLEVVSGESHDEAMRRLVLEPRGMRATTCPDLLDVVPRLAPGYVAGPGFGTLRRAAYFNVRNEPGAGAFFTTPMDLWAFARSLRAYDDQAEPVGDRRDRRFGHNGLGNGYAAYCDRYPDLDAEVVMLANVETGLFGRLRDDLRDLLLGRDPAPWEPLPEPLPYDADAGARLVGDYDLGPAAPPLTIRAGAEGLEVSAGEGFHPLSSIGVDEYFMRLKFARLSFSGTGSGLTMTWSQDGWAAPLPRRTSPG